MKKLLLAAALATAFASGPAGAADRSSASAHACAGEGRLASICKAPLFKQYTSCIDDAIPQWDPKGPVLSKMNVPPASSVLAVLVQCESIAKKLCCGRGGFPLFCSLQCMHEKCKIPVAHRAPRYLIFFLFVGFSSAGCLA